MKKTPLKRTTPLKPTGALKAKSAAKPTAAKPTKTVKTKSSIKKPSVKVLKTRIDRLFSKMIRERDTVNGYARCCTCGEVKESKQIQAGHFMSRRYMNTRWYWKNVHAQCISCNMFEAGRQYEYGQFIDKTYGPGSAEEILKLSRKVVKFNAQVLSDILEQMEAGVWYEAEPLDNEDHE